MPGTSRRLTARAKSQREGERKKAQLQLRAIQQAAPAALAARKSDDWTVAEWLDHWLLVRLPIRKGRHGSGVSEAHKRRARWACDALAESIGHIKLRNLRTSDVSSFLAARAAGEGCRRKRKGKLGWSQSSCITVRNVLADAIDDAITLEEGGVWRNAARPAAGFSEAAAAEERHAINAEQSLKLYRAARDSVDIAAPVVALLCVTGMRQHEARELRWGAVDLRRGTLRVVKAKTKTGLRLIRLSPPALDVLHTQHAALDDVSAEALVFPGLRWGTASALMLSATRSDVCVSSSRCTWATSCESCTRTSCVTPSRRCSCSKACGSISSQQ